MLTLHEVSKKTELSQNFIRLAKTKLGDILAPYIYRGDKNKLLFDESVIFLFDRINPLKMKGYRLLTSSMDSNMNSQQQCKMQTKIKQT